MVSTTVVVQSCAGREALTCATLNKLHGQGGASALSVPRIFYWTGLAASPVSPPMGWISFHDKRPPEGHRRDLWRIMRDVAGSDDLVLFEDDVLPCRNAVRYIVDWQHESLTTFHNLQRKPVGLHPVDKKWGFWGTQAIKIPARLVARFVDAGDTSANPTLRTDGGDTRIGRLLLEWGESIFYHRSLVQHVGAKSIHNPAATLTGMRAPAPDFDADFDPTVTRG